MRLLALALVLFACNLPSEDDVREATTAAADRATELCRTALREETPRLVNTVTTAAIAACSGLSGEVADTRAAVDLAVYAVLVNLGCAWDGTAWDCSTSLRCTP